MPTRGRSPQPPAPRPRPRSPHAPQSASTTATAPEEPDAGLPPHGRGRLLGFVVLTLLIVGVSSSAAWHDRLLSLFGWAESLLSAHPLGGPLLFVGLAALSALLAFFSSAALVPAGVATWGLTSTAVLLATGWLLGGILSYSIARWLGRALAVRLTSAERLSHYERRFGQRTPFAVIVLFQLALPSELPGTVLGLVRYPLWRYALALLLVEGPFAIATVWLGEEFLARRLVPMLLLLAVGGLVAFAAITTLRRRLDGAGERHRPESRT